MDVSRLLIGGKWTESDRTFPSFNPSTGEVLGQVCQAGEAEVNAACRAARQALPAWRALGAAQRSAMLQRLADLLIKEYGEQGKDSPIKSLMRAEMGKRLPEADIEVIESSDMIAFYAQNGPELLAPEDLHLNPTLWPSKRSQIRHEPVGVVGIIKPWNYPLELPIWAIAPALVSGNTIVFKPSENSPLVGAYLGQLLQKAGIPDGVFNLIQGADATGRLLTGHAGIDMISFTGSARVGREIASVCARTLRRYTLELGGNDAAIVEPDADLELTAQGLVWGAFCNSGQVCVRPKRVFIADSVIEPLVERIVALTANLRRDIDYGPLISEAQLAGVESLVGDAVRKGATILAGGKRDANNRGSYYAPTILANVTPSMALMQVECFGPVLPIAAVASTEEAIALANQTQFGLGASVWTSNRQRASSIADALAVGMVWINDVNVAFPEAPWGGVRGSGVGVELSKWGLYEYVSRKHVCMETSEDKRRSWWYPYPPSSDSEQRAS